MDVKYNGETKDVKTTKGEDAKVENGAVYYCMEKEYHSAAFVRVHLESGEHVKLKRSDLKKV